MAGLSGARDGGSGLRLNLRGRSDPSRRRTAAPTPGARARTSVRAVVSPCDVTRDRIVETPSPRRVPRLSVGWRVCRRKTLPNVRPQIGERDLAVATEKCACSARPRRGLNAILPGCSVRVASRAQAMAVQGDVPRHVEPAHWQQARWGESHFHCSSPADTNRPSR